MCAIVDSSVRDEVFGGAAPPAGRQFFTWLNEGKGKLVIGGKLRLELAASQSFVKWLRQAVNSGRATTLDDARVEKATNEVVSENICRSNDAHVIALARLSGARLLYTNDYDLEDDFKSIIPKALV